MRSSAPPKHTLHTFGSRQRRREPLPMKNGRRQWTQGRMHSCLRSWFEDHPRVITRVGSEGVVFDAELGWPFVPVSPIRRKLILFEQPWGGASDDLGDFAELPAILLPVHEHMGVDLELIRLELSSVGSSVSAVPLPSQSRRALTPSPLSSGTVPRTMPSPNIESTTVEPFLIVLSATSFSGRPRWSSRVAMWSPAAGRP